MIRKDVRKSARKQHDLDNLSGEGQFDCLEHEEQEIQQTIDDPFWRRDSLSAEEYIKQGYELVLKGGLRIWRKKARDDEQ